MRGEDIVSYVAKDGVGTFFQLAVVYILVKQHFCELGEKESTGAAFSAPNGLCLVSYELFYVVNEFFGVFGEETRSW